MYILNPRGVPTWHGTRSGKATETTTDYVIARGVHRTYIKKTDLSDHNVLITELNEIDVAERRIINAPPKGK